MVADICHGSQMATPWLSSRPGDHVDAASPTPTEPRVQFPTVWKPQIRHVPVIISKGICVKGLITAWAKEKTKYKITLN